MPHEVLWSRSAEIDLIDIVSYIGAREGHARALEILERLQPAGESLAHAAERDRRVPELSGTPHACLRELIERPWRLIYRTEADRVVVMAVLDGRRELASLLMNRLVSPGPGS